MADLLRSALVRIMRSVNPSLPKSYSESPDGNHKEIYAAREHDVSDFPFQGSAALYSFDAPAYVLKIDDARVWGNTGTVINRRNQMLSAVSNEFVDSPGKHSIFNQWRFGETQKIGGEIGLIATTAPNVYYHWLLHNFPRLHLLQAAGILDQLDGVIMNYRSLSFQDECLTKIDFPKEKIIRSAERTFAAVVKNLYVPSLPFQPFQADNVAAWACGFVKNLFISDARTPHRRLYISRKGSTGRVIENELDLWPGLQRQGFELCEPETLTVAEQARLFNEASVVVGAHGGAFANIVFCQPGAIVIDIFNDRWINPCFWDISNKTGLHYVPYFAKTPQDESRQDSKHFNIFVPKEHFFKFLGELF